MWWWLVVVVYTTGLPLQKSKFYLRLWLFLSIFYDFLWLFSIFYDLFLDFMTCFALLLNKKHHTCIDSKLLAFQFIILESLKMHENLHYGWRKFWNLYFWNGWNGIKPPPWLEKILKFTLLKWLKLHGNIVLLKCYSSNISLFLLPPFNWSRES